MRQPYRAEQERMKYQTVLTPYTAAGGLGFRNWQPRIGSLTEGFPNSQEIYSKATDKSYLWPAWITTPPQQLQEGRASPKGKYSTWWEYRLQESSQIPRRNYLEHWKNSEKVVENNEAKRVSLLHWKKIWG